MELWEQEAIVFRSLMSMGNMRISKMMDLFYFHNQKRVLFKTLEYEKVYSIVHKIHLASPVHVSVVCFLQAGLLTVLHLWVYGQQSGRCLRTFFPSGQPESSASAGAGQPDRCCRCAKPLQTGHHVF